MDSSTSLYLSASIANYMEAQEKQFNKKLIDLQKEYSGKYILFENGKVIDFDLDEDTLLDRVWETDFVKKRNGIFIKKVPLAIA
jgi:hypothetical protein